MKNILLPTDFSDNSYNAIKYALKLFKSERCTFYVLNAYIPKIYNIEYVLVNPAQFGLADVVKDKSLIGLEDTVKKIKSKFNNPNHQFKTIAAFNNLILEIKETVEEKKIDYIVMGTKGTTGAKEILFGSNTVQTFKNIKCPVLAIPSNFVFESPLEILFPSDYEINFQDKHLQPIIDIASTYHSRVNILNVSYGYDLTKAQEKNRLKLEIYFKNIAHLFHSVSNQDITQAISNFQLKTKINLLVMINNKHSFFENLFFKSTINQIGFHLNIPFLVIPSIKNKK
ncbi:universal stress protein [Yeosuana sp. MJ-SS3]|uniref:Universal stress protein n=1 Tax=Gilvirhabdus luticola TaxID=3079858 RepID=A0ABU3U5M5_9FLAO|nr:universal stress protein [Yeosuana sp. MJ-SS3]MDU8885700.1 universal stress protein [Yeosuana sp. MJ-SS3]